MKYNLIDSPSEAKKGAMGAYIINFLVFFTLFEIIFAANVCNGTISDFFARIYITTL